MRVTAAVLAVGGLAVAVAVALEAASRSTSPPPGEDVAPIGGRGNDVARQNETTGANVDASASAADASKLATSMTAGNLEVVALFDGAAPAGVTVSTLHLSLIHI